MFETYFNEICKKNNDIVYNHKSFKVDGEIGSFIHISDHHLKITHNKSTIEILYNLGNSNVAEYKIKLTPYQNIPEFEISNIENLLRLLLFKKNTWKIKCNNEVLKSQLNNILNKNGITDLAKNYAFEPVIKGFKKNENYYINTKFNIGYENKIESIDSIIRLHKDLIDLFKIKYCS